MKKRKKSLIGWTTSDWKKHFLFSDGHFPYMLIQKLIWKYCRDVFKRKDKELIKVRVTIEEL